MSDIYIVWSKNAENAQAKLEVITGGEQFRVLRRGDFPLVQAEDLDSNKYLNSGSARYCIVFEVLN